MLLERIFKKSEAQQEIITFYRNIFPEESSRPTLHEQKITALTLLYFIDIIDSYGEIYNSPISDVNGEIFLHEVHFLQKSMRYMDTKNILLENEFNELIESGEKTLDELFNEGHELLYNLREFYRGLYNSNIPYDYTVWRLLDEHLYINDLKELLKSTAYNENNLVNNDNILENFTTINEKYFNVNPYGLLTDERNNMGEFKESNILTKYILLEHYKNKNNNIGVNKIFEAFKYNMDYGEGGSFTLSDLIYCDEKLGSGAFYKLVEALIVYPEYNGIENIISNINIEDYVKNFDEEKPILWILELSRI